LRFIQKQQQQLKQQHKLKAPPTPNNTATKTPVNVNPVVAGQKATNKIAKATAARNK
jgi:hypothetical protein